MPRKEQKIKVVSYVHVGDQLVNTDDLDPERKRQLATWLKCTYLNALFEGKAKFYPVEEGEKEKHLSENQEKMYPSDMKNPPAGGRPRRDTGGGAYDKAGFIGPSGRPDDGG